MAGGVPADPREAGSPPFSTHICFFPFCDLSRGHRKQAGVERKTRPGPEYFLAEKGSERTCAGGGGSSEARDRGLRLGLGLGFLEETLGSGSLGAQWVFAE